VGTPQPSRPQASTAGEQAGNDEERSDEHHRVIPHVAIRQAEPERFERAALRWRARLCMERREATLAQVQGAAWAFDNITTD
jgi:hypothetical protein